jgi:CheY-like chemotaxis protein
VPAQFHSYRLSRICSDARRLAECIREHETAVDALLAIAEREAREATAGLAASQSAGADELRISMAAHVHQTADSVDATTRLSIGARAQHVAMRRLLADLDADELRRQAETHPLNRVVLVADDHDGVRELIAHVLEDAGFLVKTAANGLDALIAAHETRPGVIVMDVTMPVLDGIEATRLIKADPTTRDARVIAYTGDDNIEDRPGAAMFAAFLRKPATPSAVVATVQRLAAL